MGGDASIFQEGHGLGIPNGDGITSIPGGCDRLPTADKIGAGSGD